VCVREGKIEMDGREASKGNLCQDSASTLKLEWVWGASVLELREEGIMCCRQTTHNGLGSASLLFWFFF